MMAVGALLIAMLDSLICVLAPNLPAVALFARAAHSIRDDLVRAV